MLFVNVYQLTPIPSNRHLVKHAQYLNRRDHFGVESWSRESVSGSPPPAVLPLRNPRLLESGCLLLLRVHPASAAANVSPFLPCSWTVLLSDRDRGWEQLLTDRQMVVCRLASPGNSPPVAGTASRKSYYNIPHLHAT